MSKAIQAIRGMNDLLPEVMPYWHHLEAVVRDLTQSYGYQEIRYPVVEQTALFKRAVGDVTDIVEKEMYTFDDRNGDSLTLRPEGTAGCVRAGVEHGLLYNQTQRLWYMGPMFRHERPQKGRYRQFHQLGIEAFGFAGPDMDLEIIMLAKHLLQRLQLADEVELQLNSIGTKACRLAYADALVDYFSGYKADLDEDSLRRLENNPLRLLDSKNPKLASIIAEAPKLSAYLSADARQHFDKLQEMLTLLGVPYVLNEHLVRGLDYYCHTVFEWVTTELGAQGTVCAGGRYDGLVEVLGGKATPGVGFASGIERLILLLQQRQAVTELQQHPHAYLIPLDDSAEAFAWQVQQQLRQALPDLRLIMHCGGGKAKNRFKHADKSGAALALVIGEEEAAKQQITVKPLREQTEQASLDLPRLVKLLQQQVRMK